MLNFFWYSLVASGKILTQYQRKVLGYLEPKIKVSVIFKSAHIYILERGNNCNRNRFNPVFDAIHEQRPLLVTTNMKFHPDNEKSHIVKYVKAHLKSNIYKN